MAILSTLLYILFVLSAIVLIVVILLQEGRGGGFGQALGEHGQQTFGVGAKGINTFTSYTAVFFLGSALLLWWLNRDSGTRSVLPQQTTEDYMPPGLPGLAPVEAPGPVEGAEGTPKGG
jgi:preprotein translocase subunit SecG